MYHLNLLISRFDGDFFELRGKKNKEIRETRNKYNKSIIIKKDIENIEEVIGLINCWDKISGVKYGWQRHSGYDKSFFLKYYEQEKKDLFSLFFYIDGVLVGYSVVSKIMDGDCFRYIIRKFDASFRNICLYIDFKIFENLYSEYGGDFRVSWGASSGNVLKYKKKYPIFFEDKVWFYKIKNL